MDILSTIIGIFGGGLAVYLIDTVRKRGKLQIDHYSVVINYSRFKENPPSINDINLDIQFINSSGNIKTINGISARYCDGQNTYRLLFKDHTVPPAKVIEPKGVECLQFNVYSKSQIEFLRPDSHSLEFIYKIGAVTKRLIIRGDEFDKKDQTRLPVFVG